MRKYLKRFGYAGLILFSVATVVFWLFSFSFPSPEEILVTDRTDEATLDAIKRDLSLDKPKWQQYVLFMNDISPISIYNKQTEISTRHIKTLTIGNNTLLLKYPWLRRSFQTGQATSQLIQDAFKGTIILALASILIASIIGIVLGVIASVKQGSWIDQSVLFLSTIGISVPSFFSAIVLSWLFGHVLSDITGLNLSGSLYEVDPFKGRVLALKNLVLPALALGIRPLAIITQLTRNAMLDTLKQDYIRTAKAKGLSSRTIYFRHALKAAMNPVITSISGWFASLLAGAFFVEFIFNWRGLGSLTIHALETSDLPVIMGCIVFIAALFVVMNMLVDVLYRLLDPRIQK